MSITDFLLARIADDEAAARAASMNAVSWERNQTWWLEGVEHEVIGDEEVFCHPHNADHIARHDPARVLAECAAKRAIVELHEYEWMGPDDAAGMGCAHDYEEWPCPTIRALAAIYKDHPDHREDWAE